MIIRNPRVLAWPIFRADTEWLDSPIHPPKTNMSCHFDVLPKEELVNDSGSHVPKLGSFPRQNGDCGTCHP